MPTRIEANRTALASATYCINAARYLFQADPVSVMAFSANFSNKKFRHIDEMTSVRMRFSWLLFAPQTLRLVFVAHSSTCFRGTCFYRQHGVLRGNLVF